MSYSRTRYVEKALYKAIKKHSGLSDYDREAIEAEVKVIIKVLEELGFFDE